MPQPILIPPYDSVWPARSARGIRNAATDGTGRPYKRDSVHPFIVTWRRESSGLGFSAMPFSGGGGFSGAESAARGFLVGGIRSRWAVEVEVFKGGKLLVLFGLGDGNGFV